MFVWDEHNPLKRARGETAKANSALRDYAALGNDRSLRALVEQYKAQKEAESAGKARANRGQNPPTERLATLEAWSTRYQWQARIAAWIEQEYEARAARNRERRLQIEREEWEDSARLLAQLRELEAQYDAAPDAKLMHKIVNIRARIGEIRRLAVGLPNRIAQDLTPRQAPEVYIDLGGLDVDELLLLLDRLPEDD